MLTGLNVRFSNSSPKIDSSSEDEGPYEVCLANISPAERRKRLRFGIVQFAITLAILAVLLIFDVNRLWRLPLFFLFSAAATGYYQWRDKT